MMQAETIRQALTKLDELQALYDELPPPSFPIYYHLDDIRKALLKELNYAEIDLLGGLVQVTRSTTTGDLSP